MYIHVNIFINVCTICMYACIYTYCMFVCPIRVFLKNAILILDDQVRLTRCSCWRVWPPRALSRCSTMGSLRRLFLIMRTQSPSHRRCWAFLLSPGWRLVSTHTYIHTYIHIFKNHIYDVIHTYIHTHVIHTHVTFSIRYEFVEVCV